LKIISQYYSKNIECVRVIQVVCVRNYCQTLAKYVKNYTVMKSVLNPWNNVIVTIHQYLNLRIFIQDIGMYCVVRFLFYISADTGIVFVRTSISSEFVCVAHSSFVLVLHGWLERIITIISEQVKLNF